MITDIHPARRMKTLIAFVKWAIAKKDIFFTFELEFIMIIRSEIGVVRATKDFYECIIWWFMKKFLKWWFIVENRCRKSINKICGCIECILPEFEWQMSLGKKCKACFNNMFMFSLYSSIFMVDIRTWMSKLYTLVREIWHKMPEFTTPISL